MRLKVVNAKGNPIGWLRAALRYAIFAAPFFLFGFRYTGYGSVWIVTSLIIFIQLGVGGGLVYLLAFNRRTRQGLHDVLTDAYVVESMNCGPLRTRPIWNVHWSILSGYLFLIAVMALSEGMTIQWRHKSAKASQNLLDEQLIERLQGVRTAEVRLWTPTQSDGTPLGSYLSERRPAKIVVEVASQKVDREALSDQVAESILKADSRSQRQELIRIEVGRSYSLGFASGNDYESFSRTPDDWEHRLAGGPGAHP